MSEDIESVYKQWQDFKVDLRSRGMLIQEGVTPQFRGVDIAALESYGRQKDCEHPELTMSQSFYSNRTVHCTACQKKIVIPLATELTMSGSELAGMIGLAFGERWKQIVEKCV